MSTSHREADDESSSHLQDSLGSSRKGVLVRKRSGARLQGPRTQGRRRVSQHRARKSVTFDRSDEVIQYDILTPEPDMAVWEDENLSSATDSEDDLYTHDHGSKTFYLSPDMEMDLATVVQSGNPPLPPQHRASVAQPPDVSFAALSQDDAGLFVADQQDSACESFNLAESPLRATGLGIEALSPPEPLVEPWSPDTDAADIANIDTAALSQNIAKARPSLEERIEAIFSTPAPRIPHQPSRNEPLGSESPLLQPVESGAPEKPSPKANSHNDMLGLDGLHRPLTREESLRIEQKQLETQRVSEPPHFKQETSIKRRFSQRRRALLQFLNPKKAHMPDVINEEMEEAPAFTARMKPRPTSMPLLPSIGTGTNRNDFEQVLEVAAAEKDDGNIPGLPKEAFMPLAGAPYSHNAAADALPAHNISSSTPYDKPVEALRIGSQPGEICSSLSHKDDHNHTIPSASTVSIYSADGVILPMEPSTATMKHHKQRELARAAEVSACEKGPKDIFSMDTVEQVDNDATNLPSELSLPDFSDNSSFEKQVAMSSPIQTTAEHALPEISPVRASIYSETSAQISEAMRVDIASPFNLRTPQKTDLNIGFESKEWQKLPRCETAMSLNHLDSIDSFDRLAKLQSTPRESLPVLDSDLSDADVRDEGGNLNHVFNPDISTIERSSETDDIQIRTRLQDVTAESDKGAEKQRRPNFELLPRVSSPMETVIDIEVGESLANLSVDLDRLFGLAVEPSYSVRENDSVVASSTTSATHTCSTSVQILRGAEADAVTAATAAQSRRKLPTLPNAGVKTNVALLSQSSTSTLGTGTSSLVHNYKPKVPVVREENEGGENTKVIDVIASGGAEPSKSFRDLQNIDTVASAQAHTSPMPIRKPPPLSAVAPSMVSSSSHIPKTIVRAAAGVPRPSGMRSISASMREPGPPPPSSPPASKDKLLLPTLLKHTLASPPMERYAQRYAHGFGALKGEIGRLFIRVTGLKNVGLPDIRPGCSWTLTIDNGTHSVTTPPRPLSEESILDLEYQMVICENTEILCTLKAMRPIDELKVEASSSVEDVPKKSETNTSTDSSKFETNFVQLIRRLSKHLDKDSDNANDRKTHVPRKSKMSVPEPLDPGPWLDVTAADGSFGRLTLDVKTLTSRSGVRRELNLVCANPWAKDSAPASSRKCRILLRSCYISRVTELEILPLSMAAAEAAIVTARHEANSRITGVLMQVGGDCPEPKQRWFVLDNAAMIAHSETSHRPRAAIPLYKVQTVEKLPGAEFALKYPDGRSILFLAPTVEESKTWAALLTETVLTAPRRDPWLNAVLYP